MYFKEYIKMMRDRDDLTQQELANKLNVSIDSIKKIEGGSTKLPSSKLLNSIAEYEKVNSAQVMSRILFGDIDEEADELSKKVMKLAFSYFAYMYLEGWNINSLFKELYVHDIGDRQFIGELSKKRDSNYKVLVDCVRRYQLREDLIDLKDYQINFFSNIFVTMISIEKKYKAMTILFDFNEEQEVKMFKVLKSFSSDQVKTQITYVLFDSVHYKIIDTHFVTK